MKPLPCRLSRIITLLGLSLLLPKAALAQMPGPGPEHEVLKKLAGEWTATIKSAEGESKGTMVWKMICGGMWLQGDFKAELGGQPFLGHGLDGYDPVKKKFVSIWVDSMSPSLMSFEGTLSEDKKTVTLTGEGPGPDGTPVKFKSVSTQVDANHIKFTMAVIGSDGSDNEMMTIEYTRK